MLFWARERVPAVVEAGGWDAARVPLRDWRLAAEELDEIAAAAARLLDTPAALVTIVDDEAMWVAGQFNSRLRRLERGECVCAHGIAEPETILCVPDLRAEPRFAALPVAQGPEAVRFYVGAPLVVAPGRAIGMLCGVDQAPRAAPSPEHRRALRRLARAAVHRLRPADQS
jgi:GAF domain-containing protein